MHAAFGSVAGQLITARPVAAPASQRSRHRGRSPLTAQTLAVTADAAQAIIYRQHGADRSNRRSSIASDHHTNPLASR
jgi:hypothetical protein